MTRPQTLEELDTYAARLVELAESGQLMGAELQVQIDQLDQWGKEFREEADELERYQRRRRLSVVQPHG